MTVGFFTSETVGMAIPNDRGIFSIKPNYDGLTEEEKTAQTKIWEEIVQQVSEELVDEHP